MFGYHLNFFLLAGAALFLAMIGSIILALSSQKEEKKNIGIYNYQLKRKSKKSINKFK